MEVKIIGYMDWTMDNTFESANRIYDQDGLCPTIPTCAGGNIQPKILVEEECQGDIINAFNRTVDRSGISPTITTRPDGLKTSILPVVEGDNKQMEEVWTNKKPTEGQKKYRIRKLTPSECWRLMGYKDDDFNKAEKVNSATQLYKQAGNAIVKQVLMAIFLQMGIQGKKKWNEMSVEERQNLVNSSLDFLKDEN